MKPLKIKKPEFTYLLVKMPYEVDSYLIEKTIQQIVWRQYHLEKGVNFSDIDPEELDYIVIEWRTGE